MSRFPTLPPSEFSSLQNDIEGLVQIIFKEHSELDYKDAEGNYYGPYSSLVYTPELVNPWFNIAFAVNRQDRISRRERELAILAVLSVYNAPYVLYAHSRISRKANFSEEQVSNASHGIVPGDLTEEEVVAYTTALKLAGSKGPLDSEIWEQAQKVLGREKIAGLAHVVSGFIYVSILTNIGDGRVPEK
ncbi:hypothetical protein BOTCAL_0048g00110 [Botryotinia calthae]|uniref:Carboxymuconolactone decarboxylase-like domain-containing protein n=1 Tax=Botryotinia calthae TaxID=38488 RepID=A0A4Y8DB64_9HELO|nr:hypothetical protein BOTCAL_0048g00110 [Botryotinia calthae]